MEGWRQRVNEESRYFREEHAPEAAKIVGLYENSTGPIKMSGLFAVVFFDECA